MKHNPQDNPDLTAYALGELHARQAREIHDLLAASPVSMHELEQIEAVTDALRQGAPLPQERLRPEQRHAVLHPARLPARSGPLVPRLPQRRPSLFVPVMTGVLKAAAVVAVAGSAYLVGRHVGLGENGNFVHTTQPDTAPQGPVTALAESAELGQTKSATTRPRSPARTENSSKPSQIVATADASADTSETGPKSPPARAQSRSEQPVTVAAASQPQASPATTAPAAAQARPDDKPSPPAPAASATAPAVIASSRPAATPLAPARTKPVTVPGRHQTFVNASRQPSDLLPLRPAQIRATPPKVTEQLLAAPAPQRPLPAPKDGNSPRPRTPDLYIHSWKAEVTTCPWDEARRLLRITIQLPADQTAVTTAGAAYPLRVSFDPNTVREYRQLCERHQAAPELRRAGNQVIWYEYLPNGTPDANKIVATVTLDKARFTTKTVGPFDESTLQVQDRGQTWQKARGEFVFDTAVVGFGLLMRGVPDAPRLDHDLVLSLAEKAPAGTPDEQAEHARFIKLVKDAATAAGL